MGDWFGAFGQRVLEVLLAPIIIALAGLVSTFIVQKLREVGIDLNEKQQQRLRELATEAVKAIEEEARRRSLNGSPMPSGEKKALAMDIVQERGKTDIVDARMKVDAAITDLRRAPTPASFGRPGQPAA